MQKQMLEFQSKVLVLWTKVLMVEAINWLDMICFGYIQENNTWGNGNSFDLEEAEGGRLFINSKELQIKMV